MEIQEHLSRIQKTLKVAKNQRNTFGNYNYRSCEDILEAVKPLLEGCTLVISDEVVCVGARYYVKAEVTLGDGKAGIVATAYARESEEKKGMDSAQITGAASSYARKYALNGLFAIDDTKDADTQDNTKVKTESKELTRESTEARRCGEHDEVMEKKYSESKKKDYWCHRNEKGKICFGSGYID